MTTSHFSKDEGEKAQSDFDLYEEMGQLLKPVKRSTGLETVRTAVQRSHAGAVSNEESGDSLSLADSDDDSISLMSSI